MALGAPLQTTTNLSFSGGIYTLTFTTAPTSGHGVTVWFRNKLSTIATMQAGGTSLVKVASTFTNVDDELWYLPSWAGGSTLTFTLSGASSSLRAAAYEWPSGLVVSGSSTATSGTSSTPTTPSLSVTVTPALLIATTAILNGPARVSGPTNSFTDLAVPTTQDGGVGYQVVSSTASYATSWTFAGSQGWDACLAAFTEAASAPIDVNVGFKKQIDLTYGSGQKYDLYYSPTVGNVTTNPIVVYVHGGGWNSGDKSGWPPEFYALAQLGWNVYSPNYSLAPTSHWSTQLTDLQAFISHILTSGPGDTSRISLWGYSAGAHLAIMLGLSNPSTFRTIVGVAPPCNLNSMYPITTGVGQQAISDLLGYVPSSNPSGAAAASPLSLVTASAPPILVQSGDLDTLVPQSQSQELADAFTAINHPITRTVYSGLDHNMDASVPGGVTFPEVVAFLEKNGR